MTFAQAVQHIATIDWCDPSRAFGMFMVMSQSRPDLTPAQMVRVLENRCPQWVR